jgi:hypothetical protein
MGAPDSPVHYRTLSGVPATSPNRVLTVWTVGALLFGAPDSPVPHRTDTIHYPVRLLRLF